MANSKKQRDMSMVVAVGEMEGHVIEVLKIPLSSPERFEWRAVKDDEITYISMGSVVSIEAAIESAVMHFYPDAELINTAESKDDIFEVLNAQLYAGGLNQDITDIETAKEMRDMFQQHLPNIKAAAVKAHDDLDQARQALIATHGAFSDKVIALGQIDELFTHQCMVLEIIATRNVEILSHFIDIFNS